jgi:hypothetical protein
VRIRRESADGLIVEEWSFYVDSSGVGVRASLNGYTRSTRPSRRHKKWVVAAEHTRFRSHRHRPISEAPVPDDLEAVARAAIVESITIDLGREASS